jgi:hypothetical protein
MRLRRAAPALGRAALAFLEPNARETTFRAASSIFGWGGFASALGRVVGGAGRCRFCHRRRLSCGLRRSLSSRLGYRCRIGRQLRRGLRRLR